MKNTDTTFLFVVGVLMVLGLIILSSSSVVLSQRQVGEPYALFLRQLLFGVGIGGLLFWIMQRISYQRWRRLATPALLIAIVLLILAFVPGTSLRHAGAARWIQFASIAFQPSEYAKLALILFLAAIFAREAKSAGFPSALSLLIPLGLIGVPIILQPDIGTLGVIAATALGMFYLAGGKPSHVLSLIGASAVGLLALIQIAPYRLNRLIVFLHPELDPQGIGYQINQALLAIGSGGFFGRGLGHSRQKHEYLPEPAGDSIFAIGAEELGFLGAAAIIVLFVILIYRGLRIAKNAPDQFGQLLVSGIMLWVGFQAFLNIGSLIGLLPLTGIPLPLISFGSSSMIMTLAALGVVANVSKQP